MDQEQQRRPAGARRDERCGGGAGRSGGAGAAGKQRGPGPHGAALHNQAGYLSFPRVFSALGARARASCGGNATVRKLHARCRLMRADSIGVRACAQNRRLAYLRPLQRRPPRVAAHRQEQVFGARNRRHHASTQRRTRPAERKPGLATQVRRVSPAERPPPHALCVIPNCLRQSLRVRERCKERVLLTEASLWRVARVQC